MGQDESLLETHISQRFNQELQSIYARLVNMTELVRFQVDCAIESILDGNIAMARQVIARDHQVNAYEVSLDEDCINTLVRRQPAARDLRFLLMVIKAITDLERIGDEAKEIAYQTLAITEYPVHQEYLTEFYHLGQNARASLNVAVKLFETLDMESVADVENMMFGLDEHENERHDNSNREFMTFMMEDPRAIPQVLEIMWAARALERMSDRACNICNYVLFYLNGQKTHTI